MHLLTLYMSCCYLEACPSLIKSIKQWHISGLQKTRSQTEESADQVNASEDCVESCKDGSGTDMDMAIPLPGKAIKKTDGSHNKNIVSDPLILSESSVKS